ncbi:MAG: LysM peptidoglycan-binding domain-containing protein [Clostridia bacterium]|nr:LysM peptidoglycan-binding domain-containing protein [Clostridia bacterium]
MNICRKGNNRIVRRNITIMTIITIMACLLVFNSSTAISNTEIKYIDYTVCHGDTLWSIAKIVKENNINYKNKDIREIIYEIKELNNMEISNIYIGNKLTIPET